MFGLRAPGIYCPEVRNIPTAAVAIMAVGDHPRILRYAGKLSLLMTLRRLAKAS